MVAQAIMVGRVVLAEMAVVIRYHKSNVNLTLLIPSTRLNNRFSKTLSSLTLLTNS